MQLRPPQSGQQLGTHILISDVVMPGMSGRLLAERATSLLPGLKVLFVSGHAEDVIRTEGVLHGAAFLHKPYGPGELVQKVAEVIHGK